MKKTSKPNPQQQNIFTFIEAQFDAQNKRLDKRFQNIDKRFTSIDKRFTQQQAYFEKRFTEQEKRLIVLFAEFVEQNINPQFEQIRNEMATKHDLKTAINSLRHDFIADRRKDHKLLHELMKTLSEKQVLNEKDWQYLKEHYVFNPYMLDKYPQIVKEDEAKYKKN